ncbi:MAG: LysE family translocator [Pseudomonadales bacterium]
MTFELWLLLTSALLAGAISPGPSLALVLRTAITQNRLSALVVAFAHGLGITVYALAVVFGLVKVLESVSSALMLLQAGGVVFLLFLGYQMFSGGIKAKGLGAADVPGDRPTDSADEPLIQHVTNGFLIVFLNPKVAIFFVAIFSQFFNQEQTLGTQLVAAGLAGIIDTLWYVLVAMFASNHRFATRLRALSPLLDVAFGLLFIVFAVFGLFSLL